MTARKVNIPLPELNLDRLHSRAAPEVRYCDVPDCLEEGAHIAPRPERKHKKQRGRYKSTGQGENYWFCREHAREYNRNFNFFAGWRQTEIEAFAKEAVTGHRRTWRMGAALDPEDRMAAALRDGNIDDPLGLILKGRKLVKRPKLPAKVRQALAILDLSDTASLQEIKMRYKQLVKRYHPDLNGGDKTAEERFKKINEAHHQLVNCGFF